MELPIVIVRPSIVSPSWKEPTPGWVDNFNGPTGIIIGSGKGLLKTIYGEKHVTVDLTPVDVCINLFIAAAWEIGKRSFKNINTHGGCMSVYYRLHYAIWHKDTKRNHTKRD